MTRYLILGILATVAIFPSQTQARCTAEDEAGFLHTSMQRFPANIKGVLFQVPTSWPLAERDFEITSPNTVGPLRPQLSMVNLPLDSAASRELPEGTRLVRVNIPGSYRPGTSYTVRYTGQHRFPMHYPSSMTFAIDTNAVDVDAVEFKLLLDPTAVRRIHTVWAGDVGVASAAATKGITLQLPPALDMYRQAISVFHEQADVTGEATTGGFRALYNSAEACSGRDFGTAYTDQPPVVYRGCLPVLKPTAIRSSAAFLEVDDRVVVTKTTIVDWGRDMAAACAPAGQVSMFLEAGDKDAAVSAMCYMSKGTAPASRPYELQSPYMPTAGQFAELAQSSPVGRICTARFMGGLLAHGHDAPADLIELFVRLVDATLAAGDQQNKHQLLQKLSTWIQTEQVEAQKNPFTGAALHPLIPRLRLLAQEPEFASEARTVLDRIARQQ
jgi:hypothetical protein